MGQRKRFDSKEKKINSKIHLAYSCGNGLEYQVSMSHGPNSIAAGQRSCAAKATDVGDVKFGFIPVVFGAAKFRRPPGFMISATA